MSMKFFSALSQNYIELLEDDEYYDVTIEVGKDPNIKIFRAHTNILYYRFPYLRRTLKNKDKDNILTHIKLPNISPEVFQIILRYIYGGILSLNEQDTSDFLKVLVAADELLLQELVDYLQKDLIENKSDWMEQHFELIHRTSFQSNNLLELQKFCTDLMSKFPEKVFDSLDFASLPEKSLIQLIKNDDLQMKEIEVWKHVLEWGLAQNPTLLPDTNTWSDDDFKTMENTLQHCLPLIRFFSLSSKEFSDEVRPYRKLLKHQLYEDVLNSHLDPDSEPSDNILPPRNIKIDGIISSKIVNDLNIILDVSRWIGKPVIINNNKFSRIRELYLPYKFELLLRGSRDGFTPTKFHELCDNKSNTVTFIKLKETNEILGGYNPIMWLSSDPGNNNLGKTEDSFIFSFRVGPGYSNKPILSKVARADHAIYYNPKYGPRFGSDLYIGEFETKVGFSNDIKIFCRKCYYEKGIRGSTNFITGNFITENFFIEDYEVFQIVKR